MHFDSTPLGARCAYAMSLVLAEIDLARSIDYLAVAIESAYMAGLFTDSGRIPVALSSVDVLRTAFLDGMDSCAALLNDEKLLVQTPWKFSGNSHQTRIVIVESATLFRAEVEVVFSGGDREVIEVGYFPTLTVAQEQAERHEVVWHDLPEPTEVEVARFEANLARLGAEMVDFPILQLAA